VGAPAGNEPSPTPSPINGFQPPAQLAMTSEPKLDSRPLNGPVILPPLNVSPKVSDLSMIPSSLRERMEMRSPQIVESTVSAPVNPPAPSSPVNSPVVSESDSETRNSEVADASQRSQNILPQVGPSPDDNPMQAKRR